MLKGEYRDLDLSRAQVFLIDMGHSVLSTFSPASQAYAAKMLEKHGVQVRLGAAVKEVTSDGVLLSDGAKIASRTVIWAGGLRAGSLAGSLDAKRGHGGRILVWAQWPIAPLWIIGLFIGINLITTGCSQVFVAFAVRRLATEPV